MTGAISRFARARILAMAGAAVGAVLLSSCGSAAPAASTAATPTGQLFVQVDQVSVAEATSCWVMSVYHPGEGVYFRAKVLDPVTGKAMTKDDLQGVNVALPNGQALKMTYAGHPGKQPTDYFWGVLWKVPADYPTGTVDYSVTATANDGRTGKWLDWNLTSSMLTIAAR